jgi:hypothetical protein
MSESVLAVPGYVPSNNRTPDLDQLWTLSGGDYKKTEESYKKEGVNYKKPPRQLKEEKWLAQVTNPNTGEFLQPEQLKAAGLLSPDYSNNKKYPIKTVYQITRLKTADGKEWLISRQMWTGLDRLGNEVPSAMDDKETWWKPNFWREQIRLDPKDQLSRMQIRTSVTGFTKEYTLPFSAKELDKIHSLRKLGDAVSMTLRVSDSSASPRKIPRYTDFRDREFDELWEWATTPKFSLDRSIKDQLNERQYG